MKWIPSEGVTSSGWVQTLEDTFLLETALYWASDTVLHDIIICRQDNYTAGVDGLCKPVAH